MANMNPEQMRQMTSMFSTMTDDQLRSYAQMAGMGNIDPSVLRMSASMMNGMNPDDIKRMASNVIQMLIMQAPTPPTASSAASVKQSAPTSDNFPKINALKNKGNEAFKQ